MARRWGRLFLLVFVFGAGLVPRADARHVPNSMTAWKATGCDERYPRSELNGIDATVYDAEPWAGRKVLVQWTAAVYSPIGVEVEVLDGECKPVLSTSIERQGGFFVHFPIGAKWVVFHHNGSQGCRFSWT